MYIFIFRICLPREKCKLTLNSIDRLHLRVPHYPQFLIIIEVKFMSHHNILFFLVIHFKINYFHPVINWLLFKQSVYNDLFDFHIL